MGQRMRSQFETEGLSSAVEYEATVCLDLFDSPALDSLATQARAGLHLKIQPSASPLAEPSVVQVTLCEDDYGGWVALKSLETLKPAASPYQPPQPSLAEIQERIPAAIAFVHAALSQPNVYLWGGTVGPNYDCSGLVQHAFSSQGIWLPRDAYQQEAFVQPLANPGDRPQDLVNVLAPGDLIFFGTPVKATHVAIYLGEGTYIHSSGISQGRNGIGIDSLLDLTEPVSHTYCSQVRGAGRVVRSYQPGEMPWIKTAQGIAL
ncbi:MAG: C40 family peptidase [Thermosynechococcaceae cyanobacterium MS004]|nr:C40 family peptidase [Thermosynechococcaceae cyanobacterium MS004]